MTTPSYGRESKVGRFVSVIFGCEMITLPPPLYVGKKAEPFSFDFKRPHMFIVFELGKMD